MLDLGWREDRGSQGFFWACGFRLSNAVLRLNIVLDGIK